MTSVNDLQNYLRQSVSLSREVVSVPPFTLFFHPSDNLIYFNYAIPDSPVGEDTNLGEPLAKLRTEFEAWQRQPRFEFIEGFAPALAAVLRANGFEEESRLHLMMCTPETYQPAPPVPGLTLTVLNPTSSADDLRDAKFVQAQGFSLEPDKVTPATDHELEEMRLGLARSGMVLARLDGQAAGAGGFTVPLSGLTEVVGIATVPAFRQRGIATAVTAMLVQHAFENGVEAAILTAGDERAGRVYERVGFQPYATALAYIFPAQR